MEQMKFAGITLVSAPQCTFEDKFDVLDETDSELFAASKQLFHHQEDDLDFWYRYAIRITDMDCFETTEENIIVELFLVPELSSFHKSVKERVAGYYGREANELTITDMLEEGCSVIIDRETVAIHNMECGFLECPAISSMCMVIANAMSTIDSLRGFKLDRYVNRIGTTGWDMVRYMVQGKDWMKITMKRLEEQE